MDNLDGPPPFIRRGRKDHEEMEDRIEEIDRDFIVEITSLVFAVITIALIAFALLVRVFG